jgi:hypothetical protein
MQITLFRLATQYYASGRFAILNGILSVSANLFHHAIEMYLKGALAPVLDIKTMRKLKHNLPQIWACTKQAFPDVNLNIFDIAIDRLNPFERLRYPDNLLREGAHIRFVRLRNEWLPISGDPLRNEPVYDLILEEVDDLVRVIFNFANMNPAFFSSGMNPRVLAVINEANQHVIFDT